MLDLETQLHRYAEHLETRVPDIAADEILGDTGRPTVLSPARRHRRPLLVATVAAIAVLVLVGGVALLFRLVGDELPPVVTQPEEGAETEALPGPDDHAFDPGARRTLEEFVADLGEATSVETSLGTWTWRRIDPVHDLIGSPETPRPAGLEIDVSGVTLWYPYWDDGGSASFGDVTVSVLSVGVGIDWAQVYDYEPGWVEAMWVEDLRLLEIVAFQHFDNGDGSAEDRPMEVLATLEPSVVSGTPGAVEFRDVATGEVVLRVEATDPALPAELLLHAAPSCSFVCPSVLRTLYAEGAGGGMWVDPPWLGRPVVDARIALGADGLVLLVVEGTRESPTIRWWMSQDGLEWDEIAPAAPAVVPPSGVERAGLSGDGERLVMVLVAGHVPGDPDWVSVWTSTDGSIWTRGLIEGDPPEEVAVEVGAVPTSFGWMIPGTEWPNGHPQCVIWVSADAERWERVPVLPSSVPDGLGSQCYGDVPGGAGEGWWVADTVLATAFDLFDGLAWWRGGFEE